MPSMSWPRWTWASKISAPAGSSLASSSFQRSTSSSARWSVSSMILSVRARLNPKRASGEDGAVSATIVLVHGSWHGAWAWEQVLERLSERGIDAVAVDLPAHGDLHDAAASVRRQLE